MQTQTHTDTHTHAHTHTHTHTFMHTHAHTHTHTHTHTNTHAQTHTQTHTMDMLTCIMYACLLHMLNNLTFRGCTEYQCIHACIKLQVELNGNVPPIEKMDAGLSTLKACK